MHNSNILALVAIGISLFSIGLVFSQNPISDDELQEDIDAKIKDVELRINEDILTHSQQIGISNSLIIDNIENLQEQKTEFNELDDKVFSSKLETEGKLVELDDSLVLLQKYVVVELNKIKLKIEAIENQISPLPTEIVPFEPVTLVDGLGKNWTSHFIKYIEQYPCGDKFLDACYVNITQIDTPYGQGISVDSIGSADFGYDFMAYSEKYSKPLNSQVKISGKFLKNDTFYLREQREAGSYSAIYLLSEDASEILQRQNVLDWRDKNEEWFEKEITFTVSEENFRIAIGHNDIMRDDWNLYTAWADVNIDAELIE